jgi:hypothetical protein
VRLDAAMTNTTTPDPDIPDEASDPEALERQRVLGSRLRALFDDIVEEPVPDDFLELLNRLGDDAGQR